MYAPERFDHSGPTFSRFQVNLCRCWAKVASLWAEFEEFRAYFALIRAESARFQEAFGRTRPQIAQSRSILDQKGWVEAGPRDCVTCGPNSAEPGLGVKLH